jgi:Flp pilus assembly protein TadD
LNAKSALTEQDRSNASWQRNLAMDYENVGDVLKAQGKLLEALGAYQTAMQMCKQLAGRDKANDSWQDDLGSSYGKIGGVLLAQGSTFRGFGCLSARVRN